VSGRGPVQLLLALIRNSTRAGELVLDPFAGSSSPLLAYELLGRRCDAAEIEPRCVDAVRRRYRDYVDG